MNLRRTYQPLHPSVEDDLPNAPALSHQSKIVPANVSSSRAAAGETSHYLLSNPKIHLNKPLLTDLLILLRNPRQAHPSSPQNEVEVALERPHLLAFLRLRNSNPSLRLEPGMKDPAPERERPLERCRRVFPRPSILKQPHRNRQSKPTRPSPASSLPSAQQTPKLIDPRPDPRALMAQRHQATNPNLLVDFHQCQQGS
jgi:hypothetical protein